MHNYLNWVKDFVKGDADESSGSFNSSEDIEQNSSSNDSFESYRSDTFDIESLCPKTMDEYYSYAKKKLEIGKNIIEKDVNLKRKDVRFREQENQKSTDGSII